MANYLFNSSSSGETYNGKCLNVSDDSDWYPTVPPAIDPEYPGDGTIDLSGGVAGRYIDTQWIAPQDEEWAMSGIYNVVMGVSYDMYSIHYKTGNLCDIYLGSDTVPIAISEADKPYTPPTDTWKIYEEPPAIIIPDSSNLVSNGTFDTTTEPWVAGTYGGTILSLSMGGMNMDNDASGYTSSTIEFTTPLVAGLEYNYAVSFLASTQSGILKVAVQDAHDSPTDSQDIYSDYSTMPKDISGTFTATYNSTHLNVGSNSSGIPSLTIDDIIIEAV